MSRHGYYEGDCDDNESFLRAMNWSGVVASALRGKRGQAFLRALVAALDAMPEKRLIKGELETTEGSVCALGCLGKARGLDMSVFAVPKAEDDEWEDDGDGWDWDRLGAMFDIAPQLTQEVMYINDECGGPTPEARWRKVRDWAARKIRVTPEELEQP